MPLLDLLEKKIENSAEFNVYTFLSSDGSETRRITYDQLLKDTLKAASQLQNNINPGERALLIPQNQTDFITSFLACLLSGVVAVPAQMPRRNSKGSKISGIVKDCLPSLIIGDRHLYDKLALNNPELTPIKWLFTDQLGRSIEPFKPSIIGPDMPAMIQYTSGTTGNPKGVLLSHDNIMMNSASVGSAMRLEEQQAFASWLPHYHDMGLFGSILEPIISQIPAVLMSPQDFSKKPVNWLRAISKYKATISGSPNFGYQHCLDRIKDEDCEGLDLSSWRVAYCGAEIIQPSTLKNFARRFGEFGFNEAALMPCYGMAEATLMIACSAYQNGITTSKLSNQEDLKDGSKEVVSCGTVSKGGEIQIVKDHKIVDNGEVGEIWYTGGNVAVGYWNNGIDTKTVFNNSLNGPETFLRTGDLGFIREGQLYLTGRLKEMIIQRGRNFYPQDIETVAANSSDRLAQGQSAAFSIENGSEILIILQEVRRALWKKNDSEKIMDRMLIQLTDQLQVMPAVIACLKPGSLPRTTSGKISRVKARQLYLDDRLNFVAIRKIQSDASKNMTESNSKISIKDVQDGIIVLLRNVMKTKDVTITPETSVFNLGIDSLVAVDVVASMEKHFDITLDASLLWQFETVEEMAQYIFENKLNIK